MSYYYQIRQRKRYDPILETILFYLSMIVSFHQNETLCITKNVYWPDEILSIRTEL